VWKPDGRSGRTTECKPKDSSTLVVIRDYNNESLNRTVKQSIVSFVDGVWTLFQEIIHSDSNSKLIAIKLYQFIERIKRVKSNIKPGPGWPSGLGSSICTDHCNLLPMQNEFAPRFVHYKKGALDLYVIKFTNYLHKVGGSLHHYNCSSRYSWKNAAVT